MERAAGGPSGRKARGSASKQVRSIGSESWDESMPDASGTPEEQAARMVLDRIGQQMGLDRHSKGGAGGQPRHGNGGSRARSRSRGARPKQAFGRTVDKQPARSTMTPAERKGAWNGVLARSPQGSGQTGTPTGVPTATARRMAAGRDRKVKILSPEDREEIEATLRELRSILGTEESGVRVSAPAPGREHEHEAARAAVSESRQAILRRIQFLEGELERQAQAEVQMHSSEQQQVQSQHLMPEGPTITGTSSSKQKRAAQIPGGGADDRHSRGGTDADVASWEQQPGPYGLPS